jgi:hypothetical protein
LLLHGLVCMAAADAAARADAELLDEEEDVVRAAPAAEPVLVADPVAVVAAADATDAEEALDADPIPAVPAADAIDPTAAQAENNGAGRIRARALHFDAGAALGGGDFGLVCFSVYDSSPFKFMTSVYRTIDVIEKKRRVWDRELKCLKEVSFFPCAHHRRLQSVDGWRRPPGPAALVLSPRWQTHVAYAPWWPPHQSARESKRRLTRRGIVRPTSRARRGGSLDSSWNRASVYPGSGLPTLRSSSIVPVTPCKAKRRSSPTANARCAALSGQSGRASTEGGSKGRGQQR